MTRWVLILLSKVSYCEELKFCPWCIKVRDRSSRLLAVSSFCSVGNLSFLYKKKQKKQMLSTKHDSWNMTDFIPDLIIMVTFITHYFISENRQKNLWALPYFCLGCLLKSATMTSFSQPHLSRNSCFRRSLDEINLHFLALYTRWLIKKGEKCEKLSRFLVGMENFTFREMHVGEKSMGKS